MTDPKGPGGRSRSDLRDPPPGATMLARRLIEHEARGRDAAEDLARAAERVLRRLREDLARVLGGDGYAALEGRAFDLARRRYSFLGTDTSGGSARPLEEGYLTVAAGRSPAEACEALLAVCAHLIGLLFTFLGEPLTTHFIQLAWPGIAGEADGGERETR